MNGSELYQYILDNTLHELKGTWEVTQDNELKVTGTDVNGSYVVFPDALTNFSLEWDMTILSSGSYINSGISPIILSSYQGSNLEGWNNGSTVTNAELLYYICNYRGTTNFGSLLTFINGTSQGNWMDSGYQDTFVVGTKYRYKLERKNGLFKLYQDNTLISSFTDPTNGMPIYIGWYMWYGGTSWGYQANFIIDNYVVTDLSTDTTKYLNGTGLSEVWANTKNYISAQLLGYIPKSGTSALSGSIIPDTDNSYDLGDSSHNIKRVYAKEIRHGLSSGSLVCSGGDGTTNGANLVLYGTNRNDGFQGRFDLVAKGSSDYKLTGLSSGKLVWGGIAIVPSTDNGCNLGSTDYQFNTLYTSSVLNHGTGNELSLSNTADGADIALCPKGYNAGFFRIRAFNGTTRQSLIGYANGTLSWTGSPLSTSSDYRLKDEIESISNDVLDAWENLEPKQYKYKSDLENDKESAQLHYGWIAQDVESIIKGDRKGEVKNGLWLHEEWEEQAEVSHEETYTEEVQTKSGETETITKTRKVIDTPYKAKGDSYGLRYTECLVVECAYLRKKNKELQEQLDKVIARLDKLENASSK